MPINQEVQFQRHQQDLASNNSMAYSRSEKKDQMTGKKRKTLSRRPLRISPSSAKVKKAFSRRGERSKRCSGFKAKSKPMVSKDKCLRVARMVSSSNLPQLEKSKDISNFAAKVQTQVGSFQVGVTSPKPKNLKRTRSRKDKQRTYLRTCIDFPDAKRKYIPEKFLGFSCSNKRLCIASSLVNSSGSEIRARDETGL